MGCCESRDTNPTSGKLGTNEAAKYLFEQGAQEAINFHVDDDMTEQAKLDFVSLSRKSFITSEAEYFNKKKTSTVNTKNRK